MTTVAVGGPQSLSVTIDASELKRAMERAPSVVYFRLRDYLGAAFGRHRQQWLRSKGTRFGRGGEGSRAIRVFGVNEGPATPQDNHVIYRVMPAEQRLQSPAAARAGLSRLGAEAFAGSVALRVHEFGEDIRSSRFMAVPIKTRPKNPREWARRNPNKRLVARPSKKKPGELLLYEVQRKGSRGRPKKGVPKVVQERLRLRFVLTRFVDMKPTLHMYSTWQRLDSQRRERFARAADGIVKDIATGRALAKDASA